MDAGGNEKKLKGVIPAIAAPFDESGVLDEGSLERQVSYFLKAGVHGFFINGTTGEGPYLTRDEKIKVFKRVKELAAEKVLCVACINPSTEMTLDEIRVFESLEPDFIVAVTPYYYSISQSVIIKHFKEIATQSPHPVIMYNIPQNTHNQIEINTVLELSHLETIRGIKDSSGDFISFLSGLLREEEQDFSWFQGEDYLDASSLLMGADGIVTGLGNVWIEPYVALYREAKRGNVAGAKENQKMINKLYGIVNVAHGNAIPAIKGALAILGRSTKWMKCAGMTLQDDEISAVGRYLNTLDLQ